MMSGLPFDKWFTTKGNEGLCIIEFPSQIDYEVLYEVLEVLVDTNVALIHTKPVEFELWKTVFPIDATLHSRTVDTRLKHRVADNSILRFSPFSTQGFLVSLRKQSEVISRTLGHPLWWLWWTPSDLAIQKVDDSTIVECIGAIGSEYRDTNFMVFVVKEAHTERGLSLLELAPRILIDVEFHDDESKLAWQVVRHPNRELRGDLFEQEM